MKWWVLYNDWSEYNSDDHNWEDLPEIGVVKIELRWEGGKVIISGWDNYVLIPEEDGINTFYWKDEIAVDIDGNPIDDPYAGMGRNRKFYNDATSLDGDYVLNADLNVDGFDASVVKKGKWVPDDVAKQMGIL